MIQIYTVQSEALSRKHQAAVSLIYWKDAMGEARIGTRFEKHGKTLIAWAKDSSLFKRAEMALEGGRSVFENLLAQPIASCRKNAQPGEG